jgi:hypothetical protein
MYGDYPEDLGTEWQGLIPEVSEEEKIRSAAWAAASELPPIEGSWLLNIGQPQPQPQQQQQALTPQQIAFQAFRQTHAVKPLAQVRGTGWQVDVRHIAEILSVPTVSSRRDKGAFQSYEPSSNSWLNYTARGNVVPEQHVIESCAFNSVNASVNVASVPFVHSHPIDEHDLEALKEFAALDPDNLDTPTSMTILLQRGQTDHEHNIEITLSQAKFVASGRTLSVTSSEPINTTGVTSHVHMVTLGC